MNIFSFGMKMLELNTSMGISIFSWLRNMDWKFRNRVSSLIMRQMTKRRGDREVHKETEEKPGWCTDSHLPPCAAFVEIMAPVFSREAWRCVWHMIQNDLVHEWVLDFALRRCATPAHEKIGVVDSQWDYSSSNSIPWESGESSRYWFFI